jgi:hypothetical protein
MDPSLLISPVLMEQLRHRALLSALSWLRTAEAALDRTRGPADFDKALQAILEATEWLYPLVGDDAPPAVERRSEGTL